MSLPAVLERVPADSFSTNKRLIDEVASVPSKRLRNKISGCELSPWFTLTSAPPGYAFSAESPR
jgi:hypothetical protein